MRRQQDGRLAPPHGRISTNKHLDVRSNLERLLSAFVAVRAAGKICSEKALCVFPRNDYEPDICFFGPAKAALLQPDTRKFPIPDFIVEVLSESTEKWDRGTKFRDYEAHGVAEYWIVDPGAEVIEQYLLTSGAYALNLKSGTGEIASTAIHGFAMPVRAAFDLNLNIEALRSSLSKPQ